jgi:hypothetical protein
LESRELPSPHPFLREVHGHAVGSLVTALEMGGQGLLFFSRDVEPLSGIWRRRVRTGFFVPLTGRRQPMRRIVVFGSLFAVLVAVCIGGLAIAASAAPKSPSKILAPLPSEPDSPIAPLIACPNEQCGEEGGCNPGIGCVEETQDCVDLGLFPGGTCTIGTLHVVCRNGLHLHQFTCPCSCLDGQSSCGYHQYVSCV